MTGEITSPTSGSASGSGVNAPIAQLSTVTLRAEWRAFAEFLKRPVLPEARAPMRAGGVAVARLLGLDLIFLFVFLGGLLTLVAVGVELPENLNATLELNLSTVFLIVIGAPLIEELVFRSWLSGRPRYLIVIPIMLIAGVIAAFLGVSRTGEAAEIGVGLAILGGLAVSLIAMIAVWKSGPAAWFKTIFPGAFWLSSAAFALVHFANYTEGSFFVLLPLVLPQFVLGSIAAYLRVHYGLWTAIAIHALHNGIAIGLASLAMASEAGA
ncbi:CPBP family intramembrane metalloprotease [Erythrobacter insulae]|uniref:CPBP family intramembrane metalloprotease n=1 Tax=Erythrobacter insulae TaxID=2584124 RepID=A0A547PC17_9SPHN|nr:CPBP family glutamic-type intramembrane protease [Erythrobacter insulae]TRD11584.1 CPBP family intramembrane metalloprotease [Erythrobacter insulae]